MSIIKKLLVSGVVLGASAIAPSAGAVDDKVIPGTACQIFTGTADYIVDGSVQSLCPMLRNTS